jgi:hypothetical protein
LDFDHYEVVPAHIAADVIAARLKDLQAARED